MNSLVCAAGTLLAVGSLTANAQSALTWDITPGTVGTGDWARITIFSDYTAKIWVLYVNDVRAGRFGFYTQGATAFTQFLVTGVTTIDDVGITRDQPPMKDMPSLILLR